MDPEQIGPHILPEAPVQLEAELGLKERANVFSLQEVVLPIASCAHGHLVVVGVEQRFSQASQRYLDHVMFFVEVDQDSRSPFVQVAANALFGQPVASLVEP